MALQERLRPRLREDLVVVVIGGVMLAVFLAQPDNDLSVDQVPRSMDGLGVLLLGIGCVSLLARRRFPLSVVVLALALEVVWNSLGYTNGAINLPALVAFYALGTTGDRAREVAAVALDGGAARHRRGGRRSALAVVDRQHRLAGRGAAVR